MNSDIEAAERAELIQSVKALLIPLSLFLACVIMAAGTFLIYNREPLGWAFATVSVVIIVSAIVALIRFQNKHRARGIIKQSTTPEESADQGSNVVEFKPPSANEATTVSKSSRV
jgi:hypothetical protein